MLLAVDGWRLEYLRRKRGMTQDDLAEVSGLGCETVDAMENHRRHFERSSVLAVANALGVHPGAVAGPKGRLITFRPQPVPSVAFGTGSSATGVLQ